MNNDERTSEVWIKAIEAVHLISRDIGGDRAAKAAIAERVWDRALKVSTEWLAMGADVGGLPIKRPTLSSTSFGTRYAEYVSSETQSDKPALLGHAFALHSSDHDADFKRWDWAYGLFVSTQAAAVITKSQKTPLRAKLPHRIVVYGARFLRREILAIVGKSDDAPVDAPKATSKAEGRKKRTIWNYAPVIEQFRALIEAGEMKNIYGPLTARGVKAAIEEEIKSRMEKSNGDVPPDGTVKHKRRHITDLWQAWERAQKTH